MQLSRGNLLLAWFSRALFGSFAIVGVDFTSPGDRVVGGGNSSSVFDSTFVVSFDLFFYYCVVSYGWWRIGWGEGRPRRPCKGHVLPCALSMIVLSNRHPIFFMSRRTPRVKQGYCYGGC